MMIKAVFVDLDGTLLNDERKIGEFDIEKIKVAEQKGINIVITTGRARKDALEIQERLRSTRYIISSNGADIYDSKEEKVIYSSPIKKQLLLEIYKIAQKNKLKLSINTEKYLYINKLTYDDEMSYLLFDNQIKEKLENSNIVQVSLSGSDKRIMNQTKELISKFDEIKIENQSLGLIDGCIKTSKVYFCDIVNKENNKAHGIEKLCNYLNIKLDEVAAIGDSPNDIPMLKLARDKVAMKNGTKEIKTIANIITDTNNNCGVGKYIQSII